MKRNSFKRKEETAHISTLATTAGAKALVQIPLHLDFGIEGWQHSYCCRLAWKLLNKKMPWALCKAYLMVLMHKRKLVDNVEDMESLALYYMARAQVRAAKERE